MYDKKQVIDGIWQYSRFYGNMLGECENFYYEGQGYAALALLFEVAENICKNRLGDYESSFMQVVCKLRKKGVIDDNEERFLSTDEFSVRKIRNLFAHDNLMRINIVQIDDGKKIYYPLTEQASCIFLYDKISHILFNLLLKLSESEMYKEFDDEYKTAIINYNLMIEFLSAREILKLLGYSDKDIDILENTNDENQLLRMADNSSNIQVLEAIFKNLL